MKKQKEMQQLPCKLTAADLENKMHNLVRLEQEESKQKAVKKAEVAAKNAELKLLRSSIDEIVKQLDEGTEMREVEVEARFDYTTHRVTYVRLDTHEEVEARDMDNFELQENIHFEGDLLPPPAHPMPKRGRKKKSDEAFEPTGDAPEADEKPKKKGKTGKVLSIAERRARESR
jgi:hypothetical protein